MKVLNRILQILSIVFSVGSLVLFFTPFVNFVANGQSVSLVAAEMAFGAKVTVGEAVFDLARSSHILFVFWLTVIGAVLSAVAFKSKGFRYGSSAFALITAVYAWVIALSGDGRFFDTRPFEKVTEITNTSFVLFWAITCVLAAVFAIAYLFVDDYIEVKASKDKKTICQKIVLFFRDNKSEVKKIVWPSFREVIKNTITVLVMCLIIGALIWLIDFGLGQLLNLILGA